jgi:hypothetical protein
VASGFDTRALVARLNSEASLWNRHGERKRVYAHAGMSDIWVRYNSIENLGPAFNDAHESVWYPVYYEVPEFKGLIDDVYELVGGRRLGGVLVTRIPSGKQVLPHRDAGWHAEYYEKFALQLQGHPDQAFCFDGQELRPATGDLYTFNNSYTHWVKNDSPIDRITMIICIKRDDNNVLHRV